MFQVRFYHKNKIFKFISNREKNYYNTNNETKLLIFNHDVIGKKLETFALVST